MSRPGAAELGGALAAAAVAALAVRTVWSEPRRLVVRERTLALPHWPAALDGLRVALVSDIHAGGPQTRQATVRRVVERTNAASPELVLLLGDVVDTTVIGGAPVSPYAVGRELGGLRAPLGVIGVLGNHDWTNDGREVLRALREAGVRVLENEALAVAARGTRLHVVGVADAQTRRVDLVEALRDAPPGEPVLLLSHNPDVFPSIPQRVALTVSGHTHGGQVDLPLLRRWTIPSRYGDRYASGHVVEGGRHLYVTSGIGTSRWPIRLRRPPEVVLLTLRSQ